MTAFGAKRTSRERREHADPTKMTHCGHRPARNPAAQQSPAVAGVCYPFCRKHGRYWAVKRREFITLLGGAAAAWPLTARGQQPKLVRLGLLDSGSRSTDLVAANLRRQLLLGLRDVGLVEGRHFHLDQRSAEGRFDRLPGLARELAGLPVDMFLVGGEASIRAAMQATDKIPIIMTLARDPVGSGFVASLARPGGNVTGMSALAPELASKRVELLKEVVPRAERVAVLWNSSSQAKVTEWKDMQEPARNVGL